MTFSKERPFLLVGAGKMGGAMLSGWMAEGLDPSAIVVSDPGPPEEVRDLLATHGIRLVDQPPTDIRPALVMIAVKPQLMDVVLPGLASVVAADTLVLSVAAGTPVATFEAAFGKVPIVRAMPNTPAMVKRGITAAYATGAASSEQRDLVTTLLSSVGQVVWLTAEEQIDFVTGVSGSGPAYIFWLAECLAKAGEDVGLPTDLAEQLAFATVTGAGELMHQSGTHPSTLRKNVTSPNGTTAAALAVLMADDGMEPLLRDAVRAAVRRAGELAG
ncbi:pyrroline-5-carboxylate reductase [Roseibium sediminis]|uniref:pyrroline-5-carboxylate reductase n=1 Tax=Roseibium sediminis TaxID=1775174 RepID=UPI00123DD4AE|nr:pyrroline-5-carboxylate reductase [Roseibium sediminis]